MILYRSGYRYQLAQDAEIPLGPGLVPDAPYSGRYFSIDLCGLLTVRESYAWDGASGPVLQTPDLIRASLAHDVCYQAMRMGVLNAGKHRDAADRLLRSICIEDGMVHFRAEYIYQGVHLAGGQFTDPKAERKIEYAPRPFDVVVATLQQPEISP